MNGTELNYTRLNVAGINRSTVNTSFSEMGWRDDRHPKLLDAGGRDGRLALGGRLADSPREFAFVEKKIKK